MRHALILSFVMIAASLTAQFVEPDLPGLLKTIDHPVFTEGDFVVTRVFKDDHNGVSHAYGFQTHAGIEIEGTNFGAHAQGGKIVYFNERFVAEGSKMDPADHQLPLTGVWQSFFQTHKSHFAEGLVNAIREWETSGTNEWTLTDPALSPEKIRVKKTYYLQGSALIPTWSISCLLPDESHWYYSIIDGIDGSLIKEHDWKLSCKVDHNHKAEHRAGWEATPEPFSPVYTSSKKADGASYRVFALPLESPNHGSQSVEKDPADATASPYGWHDVDGSTGHDFEITRGNNVWASEDRSNLNSPGYSPDGGSTLNFNFSYTSNGEPEDNLDAAITNLFYWNNVIHDVMYRYGFDEESGNFQENNYGNHSFGDGDPVLADAMDGSGTNNANFATPPDGFTPRMQMFLWQAPRSLGVKVESPSKNAGMYYGMQASFGQQLGRTPVKGELVLVEDGTSAPTLACSPLTNSNDLDGKIALIERGDCTFATKIRNAQDAGAIAVVMFTDNRALTVMGGDGTERDIDIPAILLERPIGLSLIEELKSGTVSVQLSDSSASQQPKDSDFDNGIIAHEYGHGISNRLTGGADNTNCLTNDEQMGEGWSDYFGLALTHQPGDKPSDPRGVGTYVRNQSTSGGGIRTYPYSVDTTISQYKYEDIAVLSVPHGVGSVWCSMLWDLHWAFVGEYGFDPDWIDGTGGNNICMQLVVDGMKLQPCNPGFVDGRDAIIAADKLNNGGKNEKLIWQSFARRGLGFGADQGSTFSRTDGGMKFDIPPRFKVKLFVEKTAPAEIQEDAVLTYDISIENTTDVTLKGVKISDTLDANITFDAGSNDCEWDVDGQVLTRTIDELEPGEKIICSYNTSINEANYSQQYKQDGAEEEGGAWSTTSAQGDNAWFRQTDVKAEGEYAWSVEADNAVTDQYLIYDLGKVEESAKLSFQHSFNTQRSRHGGLVEISENGTNWMDAEALFVQGGYNNSVDETREHPLAGRFIFGGNSGGFITSVIDLSTYEGKELMVRFRFATDRATAIRGWYIDDLVVYSEVIVSNTLWAQHEEDRFNSTTQTRIDDKGAGDAIKESLSGNRVFVYPNPVRESFVVWLQQPVDAAVLTITNLNGQQLQRREFSGSEFRVDAQSLPAGCCILSIDVNGTTERHRLIKQ